MNIAIAKRSYFNEPHCGDECAYWESGGKLTLCIVDGLGHGLYAEEAAQAAVQYVSAHLSEPLAKIFAGCDRSIRLTRGVVMGIAVIDEELAVMTYGAIGNTQARLLGLNVRRLTGDPGIVGGGYRNLLEQTVELVPGQLLVMHTDGITARLDLSGYSPSVQEDLAGFARTIIDDWGRETDDSAVMIYRYGDPP